MAPSAVARAALVLAAALGAASPTSAAEPPETDLVENGDFEKGIEGWHPVHVDGSAVFAPDEKVKKSGGKSLRVERDAPGRSLLKQSTKLPLGVKEVVARCWFKVDKGARAEVDVYFFDAAGDTVGKGFVALVASGPNKKWEKAEERLEVPEKATGVGLNVKALAKGTFWLDGLAVVHAGGGSGLENGGFEKGLDGWRPVDPASGAAEVVADRSVRAAGKASAKIARTGARLLPEDGLSAEEPLSRAGSQRVRFQARVDGHPRVSVVLQVLDERGVCVATARKPVPPSTSFAAGEAVVDAPAGSKRLVVFLLVSGAGTAWFDDVSLGGGK